MNPRESRGEKTTQTDQIIEFFMKHPGKQLSPSDVAKGLDLNLQSTTTIISRLASEGVLTKEGRGSYMLNNPVSAEIISAVYQSMYATLVQGIGEKPLSEATHMEGAFDEEHPVESFQRFVEGLIPVFGKDIVDNMIEMTVQWEFKGENPEVILEGIMGMLDGGRGS